MNDQQTIIELSRRLATAEARNEELRKYQSDPGWCVAENRKLRIELRAQIAAKDSVGHDMGQALEKMRDNIFNLEDEIDKKICEISALKKEFELMTHDRNCVKDMNAQLLAQVATEKSEIKRLNSTLKYVAELAEKDEAELREARKDATDFENGWQTSEKQGTFLRARLRWCYQATMNNLINPTQSFDEWCVAIDAAMRTENPTK